MSFRKIVLVVSVSIFLLLVGVWQLGGSEPVSAAPVPAVDELKTTSALGESLSLNVTSVTTATVSAAEGMLVRVSFDGFLGNLVNGTGQRGIELWFTSQAQQNYGADWLEQFDGFDKYEITSQGWQDGAYWAKATLSQSKSTKGDKVQKVLALESREENGLWLIDKATLEATKVIPAPTAAPTAAPTSLPEKLQGKMVFVTSIGSQIYSINADGTSLQKVGDVNGIDPALSPDGTKVAYAHWVDPRGIWVANIDGSDQHHYYLSATARGPVWSSDGKLVLFWQQKGGQVNAIDDCWEFGDDDGLYIPSDAWNVKGYTNKICWTIPPDPHYQLAITTVADGSTRELTSDLYSIGPTWGPNGEIAYGSERGLAINLTDLERRWLSKFVQDTMPSWSPDGKYIVFQYWSHDHWELMRMNADGSNRINLTTTTPLGDRSENSTSAAWSPDSKHIAFITDRRGRWEFWVMDADGSNQQPLFDDGLPGGMTLEYKNVRERMISWSK